MSTKSYDRSSIFRSAWNAARTAAAAAGEGVRMHIGNAMRAAWSAAKAAEMVALPVQQQQACASPAEAVTKISAAMAEVERLEAKCAALKVEKQAAFDLLRECKKERLAAVAGEIDSCPGVCWTNEERAEAAADEATEKLDACLSDYWEACDYLRDEEREERRESLKARIAQGPAMVMQPCQQQQAQAGQSEPAAETAPAAQPQPEADEIEPSVSYKLGPIDRRCRHWERVLREDVPLPMPEDVQRAGDLPGCYAPDRGEEELFGLDAVIQGEENHHRRSRGWSYWLHVRDPKTGEIETIQATSARKAVVKDAIRLGRIDLPREILKGAGDIAALVRILSAIRAGLPIQEIVDAE